MEKFLVLVSYKNNIFDTFAFHINYALQKKGMDSKLISVYPEHIPPKLLNIFKFEVNFKKWWTKKLYKKILREEPDVIITPLRDLPPELFRKLKKENVKLILVHWNSDSFATMYRNNEYILESEFDYYFVKDKYMLYFMKDLAGLNVYYLPEFFNPDFHTPPDGCQFGIYPRITIYGTLYPYRKLILERLAEEFPDKLVIYGTIPRWINSSLNRFYAGKFITGIEKSKMIYSSLVNLNVFHYAEINSTNTRFFEIAGAGGFQIATRTEAAKELFEEDREVVYFIK